MFARIAVVFAVAVAFALAGCGGGLTQVSYRAYKPINANSKGEDTPVPVKLLFLKDNGKFKSKSFDELWEDPKKALEGDLLDMKEFVVIGDSNQKAAQVRQETFAETKPEVMYIGLVGGFGRADAGHPRQVVVSVPDAKAGIFHITAYSIELKPE